METMQRNDWLVFMFLIAATASFSVNLLVKSPVIGAVASVMFISSASVVLGRWLFKQEGKVFGFVLGSVVLLVLLALAGTFLIILGRFTETTSLAALVAIYVGLIIIWVRYELKSSKIDLVLSQSKEANNGISSRLQVRQFLYVAVFLLWVSVAFWLLWLGRTGEGGSSVWLTIPSPFTVAFFACALSLVAILFFSDLNPAVKLVLICVFSLLCHSLFVIIWYPGRYGDPWSHLAEARYIVRTGRPYAYAQMLQNLLVVDLLKFKAQYSLVAFFERMFCVDIYWIHILIVPVLWSIFTPLLAYKMTAMLALKRSKSVPFLAAFVTMIFPSLIVWGTVSVPNSMGFLFFFAAVALLVLWIRRRERRLWIVATLAVFASLLSHPQPGAFALMLLLLVTVTQKTSRRVVRAISFISIVAVYPFALYLNRAFLMPGGLWQVNNLLDFQSEISSILLIFAFIGLVVGTRSGFLDFKSSLAVFVFYVIIVCEYYFSKYGMTNLPYGAGRILAIADFLLVPFVAVGLRALVSPLSKNLFRREENPARRPLASRIRRAGPRFLGLCLVLLFLSLQATIILYQAYPQDEIMKVQPSNYELDAIRFIDGDSNRRYVVLCEPGFSSLAIGFLGSDYGYYGSGRGVFGVPEFWYPTVQMYLGMAKNPSIGYMQQAMDFANCTVSYFVVSERNTDIEKVAARTSDVLPPYRIFGDENLYVFKYPLLPQEVPGAEVRVTFDDGSSSSIQTTYSYIVESEINATLSLTGHASYNVTDFPQNWTFLELSVNNAIREFDRSSNIDSFVYVKDLAPSDTVVIKYLFDRKYADVGWKEDSFRRQWYAHPLYSGIKEKPPDIATEGNILSLSHSFVSGEYWYYYHATTANISTNQYPYIKIRWRCPIPVAVSSVYLETGASYEIIPIGSQSLSWVTTTVELPRDSLVNMVMVGMNNARNRQFAGYAGLEVDFVLFTSKTEE